MGSVRSGFSTKLITRPSASTFITPKLFESRSGTSTQAAVMSAPLEACWASSLP